VFPAKQKRPRDTKFVWFVLVKRPKKSCNFLCQEEHWICIFVPQKKGKNIELSKKDEFVLFFAKRSKHI
jgi:hypothetical protein